MRKQVSKRNRRKGQFRDWNVLLSESTRNSIEELFDSSEGGGGDFAFSYLREQYKSKYCDEKLVPATKRRQNAIAKFLETEKRNAHTNDWWRNVDDGYNILPRVDLSRFLRFVRQLIRDVLGDLDDEIVLGAFSGGATTSRSRLMGLPPLKFTGMADITEEAVPYMGLVTHLAPMLRQCQPFYDFNVVEGNVLFTVPKKTDIDRCACKEPDANMYLQKGVGLHIRKRLRRFGINLNDQSINRKLAHRGSVEGNLFTLDLSAASDSMTIEVVRTLLPAEWFEYLNDIRSPTCEINGSTQQLEMFSSMGNGFTFELESLLFWALAKAVAYFEGVSGAISVYGDDIVGPSGIYELLTFVLGKFGFLPNHDKSFATGPFRESCGGHYHAGVDVTPFYLKRSPKRLTDLIRVANQLRAWLFRDPCREHLFPSLVTKWRELRDAVPREFWGGYDTERDTQLVTPPTEGKTFRLVRLAEPRKVDELGKYLFWHNTNWNRRLDPEDPAAPTVSTNQKCRRRPSKPGAPATSDWLYDELLLWIRSSS